MSVWSVSAGDPAMQHQCGKQLIVRLSCDNSSQTSIRPECREGWHHETNTDTDNVNDDHGSVMGM